MKKIANQVVFIDATTASYNSVETWDCIFDISKFPIPRVGEHVNLFDKNKCECIDYVVTDIKYAYKKFDGNLLKDDTTVIYISIYVKRLR